MTIINDSKNLINSDIAEIKQEIYDMLTQPIAIDVTDGDDVAEHKPNTSIDKIVENASVRESGELTDQLWDVLKGIKYLQNQNRNVEQLLKY